MNFLKKNLVKHVKIYIICFFFLNEILLAASNVNVLNAWKFEKNNYISDSKLSSLLEFERNLKIDEDFIDESLVKIKNLYKREGFLYASVYVTKVKCGSGNIELIFDIEEYERYKIGSVKILTNGENNLKLSEGFKNFTGKFYNIENKEKMIAKLNNTFVSKAKEINFVTSSSETDDGHFVDVRIFLDLDSKNVLSNLEKKENQKKELNNLDVILLEKDTIISELKAKLESESLGKQKYKEKVSDLEKKVNNLLESEKNLELKIYNINSMFLDKLNAIEKIKNDFDLILSRSKEEIIKQQNEIELKKIAVTKIDNDNELVKLESKKIDLTAKVIVVNSSLQFIVINKGIMQGIEKDMTFNVMSNDKIIGKCLVIETRENISAADIITQNADINVGNFVKFLNK